MPPASTIHSAQSSRFVNCQGLTPIFQGLTPIFLGGAMQPAPVVAGMQRHSMRVTEREPERLAARVRKQAG